MKTPAISFVAKSGTGKTTLLEKVIAELKDRGYKVGAIKHDAPRFDIDHRGKNSYRLTLGRRRHHLDQFAGETCSGQEA